MSNIELIKNNLKPGKPLMVIGPHGCGKLASVRAAVSQLSYKEKLVFLAMTDEFDLYITKLLKPSFSNEVLIIDMEYAKPNIYQYLFEAARNPDRIIVFVDAKCDSLALAGRCKLLKYTDSFPYKLNEV